MLFREIINQENVKQSLVEMLQFNRLSHALLFLGKEGSGGLPLAIAFAQYVVCEKVNNRSASSQNTVSLFGFEETDATPSPTFLTDACGICNACKKAHQLVHPDIHFSFPVIPKKSGDKPVSSDYIKEWREFIKLLPYGNAYDWLQFIDAENRQGNITAEECNEIIRQLSLKSFESEYKVLIMWLPEYLGKEGNKLLKLIEEPPANTLFLLVAQNEEQILPTILSRTQLVKISLLEDSEIEKALIEKNNTPPLQAKQAASIAQGNYREALQLLQHAEEDWLTMLREWLNITVKSNPAAQVKWVDEMGKLGREKQKQFLLFFNHLLGQCVRLRFIEPENISASEREIEFAQRLNKIAGVPQQQAILKELDNATYYIERNANGKMLFQALTIKLNHIINDKVIVSAV